MVCGAAALMQEVGAMAAEVHCCASVPKVVPDLRCSMHCMPCVHIQNRVGEIVGGLPSLRLTKGLYNNDTYSLLAHMRLMDTQLACWGCLVWPSLIRAPAKSGSEMLRALKGHRTIVSKPPFRKSICPSNLTQHCSTWTIQRYSVNIM